MMDGGGGDGRQVHCPAPAPSPGLVTCWLSPSPDAPLPPQHSLLLPSTPHKGGRREILKIIPIIWQFYGKKKNRKHDMLHHNAQHADHL